MKKFCCFGSLNLDYVYHLPHFVMPGETLGCTARDCNAGGKGLNQSCALAHAGADVYHAGNIGADGVFLLQTLDRHGVKTDFVRTVDTPTGHAIIQVDANGENCIILFGGANQTADAAQMDEVLSHFGKGDMLVLQNEINDISLLIQKAHDIGMQVVLNPSPFDDKILSLPLNLVDIFFVNEVEGAALTGMTPDEPEKMLAALSEKFPQAEIILTLGSKGACAVKDGVSCYQLAFAVKAVDTTAAGDTFTGYYLTMRAGGESMKRALLVAAKASSVAVTRKGAADSIPTMAEMQELI